MTKLKKLLLTLAPISAVMIATPIILTSCSTNAEQNNGGGTGNGTGGSSGSGGGSENGGNPGGGSGGGTTTNPALEGDRTNKDVFKPETKDGLFKTIENTVKAGTPDKVKEQTEKAIKDYTTLKSEDIKDAIDVWSFNKWIGAKREKVKYTSSIDNYVANKKDKTKNIWDISFTYKFKVVTTYDSKTEDIYAEKTFDVKDADLATTKGIVDFTTKASSFMVDGKNMLEGTPKLYNAKAENTETETVKAVKAFLNADKSNFNIRTIADGFVTNNKIVGEATAQKEGEWLDTIDTASGAAIIDSNKKTLTVDLSKIDKSKPWYGLHKETNETTARNAVFGGKENILTDTFKKLIFGNENMKKITVNPATVSKGLTFIITYDAKTNESLTLKLVNVSGVK